MRPTITDTNIRDVLQQFNDPINGDDIVTAKRIGGISIRDNMVQIVIEIPPSLARQQHIRHDYEALKQKIEQTLKQDEHIKAVSVILSLSDDKVSEATRKPTNQPSPIGRHGDNKKINRDHIQHIIAVASGKGGVGKSTTAVNLAISLQQRGLNIGLLDADIYGPSLHVMLGLQGQKPSQHNDKMIPLNAYGLKTMSIGLLLNEDQPVIWRGPMVMGALQQLLGDVAWADSDNPLDILVVDLPPGTGDAQLTLCQNIDLSGAIIVTTPQDIARIDAKRGYMMFERVNTPILGMIENMSYFICPHCGETSHIFDHGKAIEEAEDLSCDFLGTIPLDIALRHHSDDGQPMVHAMPQHAISKIYHHIAAQICQKLF